MNNEIKELVERVRLTDKEIATSIGTDHAISGFVVEDVDFRRVAQAQLNKVLNDPDLYIKDELNSRVDVVLYIPLAEELESK